MSTLAVPSSQYTVPPGAQIDPADDNHLLGLPPFGTIGEDGSGHGQALAYFQRIGQEGDQAREDPVKQAESNAKVYQWGKECQAVPGEIISNEIMGCVLAITDLQTREPTPILIRPVQTRDKPQVFWIGPPVDPNTAMLTGLPVGLGMEPVLDPITGQQAMQPVMDPMSGQPIGMQPMMRPATTPTPLDELTAWQIKKLSATGAFPAEWFVSVDDRLVADVYQTVFDVMWAEAHLDDFVYENVLKTNIYGYQGSYYSWDDQHKKHVVRDISIKQLLLDANAEGSNFDLQNCPGFEVVMDIDQAKADWPQLTDLLEHYARAGSPARVDSVSEFGMASDREFGRRTVTFRIHWFRNQLVPMLPQEAVQAGLVVDDGQGGYFSTQEQANGAGSALPDNAGAGASEGDLSQGPGLGDSTIPAQPITTGGDGTELGSGGSGESTQPVDQSVQQVAPQWPMTLAIRQMAALAGAQRIVQDIRCEYWDIPMMLNVCIPLPSQPFGQGLPEKLKGMQEADIRLLTAVVKYAETFATPGSMIPQSVAEAMKKGLKRMHIDPTETIVVPDDLVRQFGEKAMMWFQPPPLPPAVPEVMSMLQERSQRTSGHSEVMQGKSPSPSSSGRLVEALQAGQTGMAMFQAQWTARMRERLANLMHYSHLWRLGVPEIMQIYRRLPEPIMQLVVERARQGRWDNHVDASSGGAAARKLQQALALFSATSSTGEPAMPLRMLRETANLDDEECTIAYRQELQNVAGVAMPVPTQPGPQNDPSGASPHPNQPAMA